MNQKTIMILFVLIFWTGKVFADDNGKLQLDLNVITNSGGGLGTASDFPIRNELFSPALDQRAQEQRPDQVPEQRRALDFAQQPTLYDTNTAQMTKQLFANYNPEVIPSNTEKRGSGVIIWNWLLSIGAIPLVFLAIFLGRKNAKRSLRKKK